MRLDRREFLKKILGSAFFFLEASSSKGLNLNSSAEALQNPPKATNSQTKDPLFFEYELGGKKIRHKYVLGTELFMQSEVPKPEKGRVYFDPIFGTKIIRISDRMIDKLNLWKKDYGSLMHPAYPKHNYDNADGSYLLFFGSFGSGQALYDARSLKLMKALTPKAVSWSQPVEPRWDAHNPDILYYHWLPSTSLFEYNVKTDRFQALHDFLKDFPGATTITMAEEGDCSYDSRYFVFLVLAPRNGSKWSHTTVFCYDRVENRITGKIELPIPGFERQGGGNWVGMSPSGKYALLGTAPMLVYDREFKRPPVKLTHGGGWHCDVGLDDEGREVIFYVGGRTYSPGGQSDRAFAMCDLETGTETVLSGKIDGIGDPIGAHFDCSCIFTPGWGLVSTYHAAPPKQTRWTEFAIFLIELTRRKDPPPRIWRISHTHVNREYANDDPFATFDRFGTKIFFGSNWGTPLREGGDVDVYQVELPPRWYDDLMGGEKAAKLRKVAREMARRKW
jgi:hypothetical protein